MSIAKHPLNRESEFGRLLFRHLKLFSATRSELSREVAIRHVAGSSDDLAREAGDNDKLKKRERFNQVYR